MKIVKAFKIAVVAAVCVLVFAREAEGGFVYMRLPEFPPAGGGEWINSAPLKKADLAGGVTLVYFWAFDCWNSYRSFPWLHALEERFSGKDFRMVGIHTPEFEHEKSRRNLERKVKEFGVTHPVMMDNSFSYWKRMKNRYWPAFYLVDREGVVVYRMIGETHPGQEKAERFEEVADALVNR